MSILTNLIEYNNLNDVRLNSCFLFFVQNIKNDLVLVYKL